MKIRGFIQKLLSDSLARNSAIVFAGTMTANVLSYLYHLVMGRLLGPAGYGELSSLLSLLYIFTVPLLVAQTVMVKFVSVFKARGEVGQAKSLFIKATKWFAVLSVAGVPVMLLTAPLVTSFLHLPSTLLFTMVYLLLAVSLLSMVSNSILTGYQKFIWVSVMGAVAILVKLLISIPLASWFVPGVLVAAVIAGFIMYGLYFIPLRPILSSAGKPMQLRKRDAFGFAVPTLLAQLGITSLYSTDIILVRHFFSAESAGLYAALAILGKVIFYASSAVPTVLFPIASERTALGGGTKKLIVSAVGAVALISIVITGLYFMFPDIIVGLLFGKAYTSAAGLLGRFGIFLGLFSIANIITIACLAIGKLRIWLIAAAAAIAQITGIVMFHATIEGVITINTVISFLYVMAAGGYYLIDSHEKI